MTLIQVAFDAVQPAARSPFDWDATITAFFTAVAGLAAASAVWLTVKGAREERDQRRTDKRSSQYGAHISGPAMNALHQYRKDAQALLKDRLPHVKRVCSTGSSPHDLVLQETQKLIDSCDDLYYDLRAFLTVGAEAWDSNDLRQRLYEAVDELQDDLNLAIESLGKRASPDFDAIVTAGAGRILKVVLAFDPGTRPPVKDVKKKWAWKFW